MLTGDIGGTKTLLALHDDAGAIVLRGQFASRDAATFDELVGRFLADAAASPRVASFGIAGPVLEPRVKVTHLPWEIDATALAARFGFARVHLLNDFAASAHGIDALAHGDLLTLQPGEPMAQRPKVVIGAGTGLGLAYMMGTSVLSGEAGHAAFAPAGAMQGALWQWLHERDGRVPVEHVVSGRGLVNINQFLIERSGTSGLHDNGRTSQAGDPAAAIGRRGLVEGDPIALAAIDLFIDCYGALAGDHALAVLARGGVYVTGGIAPKLLARLSAGGFVRAFNDKGACSAWTRACPIHVVTNPDLPLLGAARYALHAADVR
jgi:glucokinase